VVRSATPAHILTKQRKLTKVEAAQLFGVKQLNICASLVGDAVGAIIRWVWGIGLEAN
jgi:hypothetical protein